MANVKLFKSFVTNIPIAPGGTQYMIFEDIAFGSGAITVTAHAARGVSGTVADFMEVIQMATRLENPTTGQRRLLDIVIRNNNPNGSWIGQYWVHIGIIVP